MKIMTIGDIVGECGSDFIRRELPELAKQYGSDMIIANGENAATGNGLDIDTAEKLFAGGVDVITSGNHIWNKHEMQNRIDDYPNILRPANYPGSCPGNGYVIFNAGNIKVLVISLLGNVYMEAFDSPFDTAKRILERENGKYDVSVIDFHAEATSEKAALARYLDGAVTAVVGTHTHVQTSDARIFAKGTAFITDLGMTGPHDSILGVKEECILYKFTTKMPVRFEQADGTVQFNAAITDIDESTFKAKSITAINLIK